MGLLDCDIYGSSVPLMMGVNERPLVSPEEKLVLLMNHGVKPMSMGFLLEGDQPVIWRGPMIMKTIQQFVPQVDWGTQDYLLVDLLAGTGDAQLSLCQTVPLDGGVVVTTLQEASLGVVRKGIACLCERAVAGHREKHELLHRPGERVEIFGHGGGKGRGAESGTTFLGEVPIFTEIREGGDAGVPAVVSAPESAPAEAFGKVAATLREVLD